MSTVTVDTLEGKTSGQQTDINQLNKQTCKVWVNFDGTGIPTIRDDYNVSSITDNGTGNWTVNFTNAMPDINYAGIVTVGTSNTASTSVDNLTVNSCDVRAADPGLVDESIVMLAIFGN